MSVRDVLLRQRLREQFGNKCSRCGYNRCARALQFHHTDDSEKQEWSGKYGESSNFGRASSAEISAHPDRFLLLCANCHHEEHDRTAKEQYTYHVCAECGEKFRSGLSRKALGRDNCCSRACLSKQRRKKAIAQTSLIPRFWKYANASEGDGCWNWMGGSIRGCPVLPVMTERGPSARSAIRISYELHHGPIQSGIRVKRSCNNPSCVNPQHLIA